MPVSFSMNAKIVRQGLNQRPGIAVFIVVMGPPPVHPGKTINPVVPEIRIEFWVSPHWNIIA